MFAHTIQALKSSGSEPDRDRATRVTARLKLVACGGGARPVAETPEGTPTARPLFTSDFEGGCRRGTVERAPTWPDDGDIQPVMIFRQEPDKEYFYEISTLALTVPWMAAARRVTTTWSRCCA